MQTKTKKTWKRSLALLMTVLMAMSCFSAGLSALAVISGVPTRDTKDSFFGDATLYGAEKWDKTRDLATLTFNWDEYSGSIGYDPRGGSMQFSYPSHIYLNVGETLEAAGYMGHMTASYGEDDNSDATDFRILLSSATWGESTRAGFSPISSLISGYGHQGTCTEGSKIMTGSSSHYDFSNDGRGSDQIIGDKSGDNENFLASNESVVVWRSNIQWTGSDMNNFDEYVLLKGTAAKAGEVTFNPTQNFTIGAAQRYTTFAWHSDNGTRFNRFAMSGGSRPQTTPTENALSMTFTVYDKSELNSLITAADNGNYTLQEGQTVEQFQAALAAAKAVRANREVTQDEIDAAAAGIGDKMTLLVNANEPNYTSAGADTGLATGDGSANTFNAVAYHCADPATGTKNWENRNDVDDYDELVYGVYGNAYRNLVYAPYDQTEWIEKEWHNCYTTLATPRNIVMVYDGVAGHEPMSPIMMQLKGNGSNGPRAVDYLAVDEDVPSLVFQRQWAGYMDESNNGYMQWPDEADGRNNITFDKNSYINYQVRDRNDLHRLQTENQSNKNTRRDYGNAFVYVGTGDTTNYFEKFSETKLHYSHTWFQGWPLSNAVDDEKIPSKGDIYVINYKPIYDKLSDAAAVKAIIEGDTAWQYTEASVKRAKGTIMAMIAANPKNFFVSGGPGVSNATPAEDVNGQVSLCAAAIKDAKYMLDNNGLTLEKKQGTVTFVNQLGNTVQINGQPATYTKDYGEIIAANEIPQLSNAYYRTDTAQWDYSEELSWSPALPNTITVDEPEKIFQISDEQTVQTYTVTFYDEDGTTALASAAWQYGDYPDYGSTMIKQLVQDGSYTDAYEVTAPTKQDYDYNYEVTGWTDGEGAAFNGLNAVLNQFTAEGTNYNSRAYLEGNKFTKYVAVYTKTARTNADYTAYNAALAAAQAVLAIAGLSDSAKTAIQDVIADAATLAHDNQNRNYRSDDATGVQKIADAVTALKGIVTTYTDGNGNLKDDYKATFTVTWSVNGTSTEETYKYGDMPSFKGSTAKDATSLYTYTFTCWEPGIAAVTGPITYVAQYSSELTEDASQAINQANAIIEDENDESSDNDYDDTFIDNLEKQLAILNDDDKTDAEKEDAIEALEELVGKTLYDITWTTNDGSAIVKTPAGYTPAAPTVSGYTVDAHAYIFDAWSPEVAAATADTNYTAQYKLDETNTTHTYAVVENSWAWTGSDETGYTAATVDLKCADCDAALNDQAAVIATNTVAAQHLVDGSTTYTATVTVGAQTFSDAKVVTIKAEGHTWDYSSADVTYAWEDDFSACTASVPCTGCNEKQSVAAKRIDSEITTLATCKVEGVKTYTAVFDEADLGDSKTENLGFAAHNYGSLIEAVPAADCVHTGKVAHYQCSVCEKFFDAEMNEITDLSDDITGPHSYTASITTRPVLTDGTWSKGEKTYVCANDASHTYTEEVDRADYSAYDAALEALNAILALDLADASIKEAINAVITANTIENDRVQPDEQDVVDTAAAALQAKFNAVKDSIYDGEGNVKDEALKHYIVTWMNGTTELEKDVNVVSGSEAFYDGAVPTKAADAQYHYTFIGWNTNENAETKLDTLPKVTVDVTYYAIFSAAPRGEADYTNYDEALADLNAFKEANPTINVAEIANAISIAAAKAYPNGEGNKLTEAGQDQVDDATALLVNALAAAKAAKLAADAADDLEAALDDAQSIDKTDLTDESKTALEDAIAKAEDALDDDPLDQNKIDEAAQDLADAVNGLKYDVDTTDLSNKKTEADAIDTTNLSDATKAALEEAIEKAADALDDPNTNLTKVQKDALDSKIDEAMTALEAAITAANQELENLDLTVNTTALELAIAAAQEILNNQADLYTTATLNALQTALTNGQTALENAVPVANVQEQAAKQTAVDEATAALTAALNALTKKDAAEYNNYYEALGKLESLLNSDEVPGGIKNEIRDVINEAKAEAFDENGGKYKIDASAEDKAKIVDATDKLNAEFAKYTDENGAFLNDYKNHTLTIDYNDGKTAIFYYTNYKGQTYTLQTIPTKKFYSFKGWKLVSGEGTLNGNVFTFGASNAYIQAEFEGIQYTINVDNNGDGAVDYTIYQAYDNGLTIPTQAAVDKEGYIFTGWTDQKGNAYPSTGSIRLNVNERDTTITLTAQYKADSSGQSSGDDSEHNNPYSGFRCKLCDKNDAIQASDVFVGVKIIWRIVHFFVHWISSIGWMS